MKNINVPELDKCLSTSTQNSQVYLLQNAHTASFYEYSKYFLDAGFEKKEERVRDGQLFAAYLFDGTGVFMNYFSGTHELYIAVEENTKYFEYTDKKRNVSVQPQFTHINLDLFGLSYVIRLSDGRFVVFDGGTFLPDAERLLGVLKAGTRDPKPVIAAWFLTHPHADHFLGMKFFLENFMDEVVIESFMFNLPRLDDVEHFPCLKAIHPVNDSCIFDDMNEIFKMIDISGAEVYTTHTGQIYEIGGVKFEILISVDDVVNTLVVDNINVTSMVVKFEIEGQTFVITGDSRSGDNNIVYKYRNYLKCDFLQIPHHGNKSGANSPERKLYNYASPTVCLLPTDEQRALFDFTPFRPGMNYLYNKIDYEEIILGAPTRTLNLPYTPPKYAKEEFKAKLNEGIRSNGVKTWVFSGLNTSNPEDLVFNLTSFLIHWETEINIDVLFEAPTERLNNIKTTLSAGTLKIIDLSLDPAFENVPADIACTVRFRSTNPIIVSNPGRKADYQA